MLLLVGLFVGALVSVAAAVLGAGRSPRLALLGLALGVLVGIGYFTWFWSAEGKTPGNLLLRITVVRSDGSPLSAMRALPRAVIAYLSLVLVLPALVSLVLIPLSAQRQALHDLIVDTVVVRA